MSSLFVYHLNLTSISLSCEFKLFTWQQRIRMNLFISLIWRGAEKLSTRPISQNLDVIVSGKSVFIVWSTKLQNPCVYFFIWFIDWINRKCWFSSAGLRPVVIVTVEEKERISVSICDAIWCKQMADNYGDVLCQLLTWKYSDKGYRTVCETFNSVNCWNCWLYLSSHLIPLTKYPKNELDSWAVANTEVVSQVSTKLFEIQPETISIQQVDFEAFWAIWNEM